jgi:hypothetical protein
VACSVTHHQIHRPHRPIDQGREDLGISPEVRDGSRLTAVVDTVDGEDDSITSANAEEAVDTRKTRERNVRRDVGSRQTPAPTIGQWTVSRDFVLHSEPVAPRHARSIGCALDDHGQ